MSLATEFAPSVPVPARARLHLAPLPAEIPGDAAIGAGATVHVLRAPSRSEYAAPVRLTRRGVVVLALAVALLGAALLWLAGASSPAAPAAPATEAAQVTVAPGDTLWSIASRVAPHTDPRAEVALLQKVNHLTGVDLAVGQVLALH